MHKKRLVLPVMIMLCSTVSWTKAPSVMVLQKAIACASISDFDPFFKVEFESKGTQHLSAPPSNCIFVESGTILTGPFSSEDRQFYNRKHTFFLIQPTQGEKQKRWIPDYFVKPLE
jgi:hypothetical protein